MYEVVRTINGHQITRMIGTRGIYHVVVRTGQGFTESRTFRTIKAAVEFIEKAL